MAPLWPALRLSTSLPSFTSAATTPSAVSVSYPRNSVAPTFSRNGNHTVSLAVSPEPAHAARALARWRSIASVKDATSTAKPRLFQPQRFLDQVFGAHQFGIGLAHFAHQRPDQPMHQRVPGAEQLRMAHGAAHDPPQHIAAAFIRGQHAVGDQK